MKYLVTQQIRNVQKYQPLTVGGANKASLIARRNSNRASQVSGSIILDVRDKSCNVLKTR